MSSIVLSPGATGAAAFTIEAPSTATSRVITLPDATDTLVGKATTDTLTNKTLVAPALGTPASGDLTNCTNKVISGTAQASTSGTSIDFTGIPSGVKRVTVMFDSVSTNGASGWILQIGDSGGIETTSYSSQVGFGGSGSNANTSTIGFIIMPASAGINTDIYVGVPIILCLLSSSTNTWAAINGGGFSQSGTPYFIGGGGNKSLSGTLDRIRITTINGTDAFDAGSINILYES